MTTSTTTDGNKTPTRPIRVPLDLWAQFGDVAKQLGTDRTKLLLEYMRYMTRHPGAKLPKRPDLPPAAGS